MYRIDLSKNISIIFKNKNSSNCELMEAIGVLVSMLAEAEKDNKTDRHKLKEMMNMFIDMIYNNGKRIS